MMRVIVAVLFGVALSASALAADSAENAAAPVCKRAQINPVSGAVFCIDPLGAEVAPPPEAAAPCKHGKQAGGIWTPGSGCSEE